MDNLIELIDIKLVVIMNHFYMLLLINSNLSLSLSSLYFLNVAYSVYTYIKLESQF